MSARAVSRPEVLIVGAGPTGLVLGLALTRLGIAVRLIDRSAGPATASRALAVQARTLELYRQLDLADQVVGHGHEIQAINLWTRGRRAAHAELGRMGAGLSPFPYVLIYPQDEHERLLIAHLAALGVTVERSTELLGCEDSARGVRARLRHDGGGEETCEVAYLAGCDGASSVVRQAHSVGFPGGDYDRVFYVADVRARGPVMNGELHLALDDSDFVAVFPLAADGRARLIGTIEASAVHERFGWDDVATGVLERMHIDVEQVHWFSTYHVHHRVAERFRVGRAFLLGDAAHIHSPVGGQGMNTGIGDAMNLAWKLAMVLRGAAPARLLDSYEGERIGFARRLEHTTDQAFVLINRRGPLADLVRTRVAPALLSVLVRAASVRRFLFRTVSQIEIRYRGGPLAQGHAGRVHGGDRLPWVASGSEDNFTPLASLRWQVHVYGHAGADLTQACTARHLPLFVAPWTDAAARAGLARDAAYLVRPDGHVALADPAASAPRLAAFLDQHELRPELLRAAPGRANVPAGGHHDQDGSAGHEGRQDR
jgi:2-polyprenyl-6-methoxyphenol hydroxylase-like FAD-dependent oxidoreductase